MIRYRLTHRTIYDYETPATRARHFLHLLPRSGPGQTVRTATIEITPYPDDRNDETDYFGNRVTSIGIAAPHDRLEVVVHAEIDLAPAPLATAAAMPWDAIAHAERLPPEIAEFRAPSPLTRADDTVHRYVADCFPPGADPLNATKTLMHRLHAAFRYQPGATTITTTGASALHRQEGVCQDYAHAMLACLRALRLPARYVSGYLRSTASATGIHHRGAEQTHAWVSVWLGAAHGWAGFDPTNDCMVSGDHVILAWGRDYNDVSPMRGVLLGGGRHLPKVSVALEPFP